MTELVHGIAVAPFKDMVGSPAFFAEVLISGVFAGLMYSLVALGFVLIFKASGVFNFAQGVMVLFAALTLVGLMERGVPVAAALVLTMVVMILLAFAIERLVLRPLVNQEHIILFMATIGLTFFLEGFGELLWGSNVKRLDIGIPDAPLNVSKVAIATPLLAAMFVVAVVTGLAILVIWRMRAARRAIDELGSSAVSVLPGPLGMAAVVLGLVFFLARFAFGADAAFIQGKPSKTAMLLATLSWTGLTMVLSVALFSAATWLGRRQALRDAGSLVPPLH